MGREGKLYEDALKLSVNKNLADIKTLLDWAVKADSIAEKLKHIRQSRELLSDIEGNLADLQD
jgi:hypothetical protein